MASILYAWEFGAGLGHVGPFMPLARALRDRGHHVHWAVTQPTAVAGFLAEHGFVCMQAPRASEAAEPSPPLSYADILLRYGYRSSQTVLGLVQAWRGLMQVTGATLVVADHAPTAILAARTLGLPVLMFSTGFSMPPGVAPLPNMRPWCPVPEHALVERDHLARDTINAVLQCFNRPALSSTAALFDVDEPAILTFPELDHYPNRGVFTYWGSLPYFGNGQSVVWSGATAPKWFVYVRQQAPHHVAVLEALMASGHQASVYFPDVPEALLPRFLGSGVQISRQPLDLQQMTQDVDAAVCYSSVQTTTAFLLAGKPVLLLPWHLEQFMLAMRVRDMGCGQVVEPDQLQPNIPALMADVLENPRYRNNAQSFAAKYRGFDQSRVLTHLIRRVEALAQTQ